MGTYYFHIRDEFGTILDLDGIEVADQATLLIEAVRSADEFASEAIPKNGMRLEVADSDGRTVLVLPVQQSSTTWQMLSELSLASESIN
jgi:hypothetical protein